MRTLIAAAAIALLTVPAYADTMAHCSAAWNGMAAADKTKTTYKAWSSTCLKSGYTVASAPAASAVPAGATGQCKDGTYTTSKTRSGACSGHGGVAKWL